MDDQWIDRLNIKVIIVGIIERADAEGVVGCLESDNGIGCDLSVDPSLIVVDLPRIDLGVDDVDDMLVSELLLTAAVVKDAEPCTESEIGERLPVGVQLQFALVSIKAGSVSDGDMSVPR